MKPKTISTFVEGEIIIPSKMNGLTIGQVEALWPDKKEIPFYPSGLFYRRGTFEATRVLNGERTYIGASVDFLTALNALISFCEKNRIKI